MCPLDRWRKKSILFILASTGWRVLLFFGLPLEQVDIHYNSWVNIPYWPFRIKEGDLPHN